MNDIIYLSGPMNGYDNYNFDAFDMWADRLRESGYVVLSPAETAGGAQHLDRHWYFRFDFAIIATVNYVFLMPGWNESAGAKAEAIMACEMGIPLYELHEADGSFLLVEVSDLSWGVEFKRGVEGL